MMAFFFGTGQFPDNFLQFAKAACLCLSVSYIRLIAVYLEKMTLIAFCESPGSVSPLLNPALFTRKKMDLFDKPTPCIY